MGLPPLSIDEIARYSRHLRLPHIGMRGQQRLKAASVLVVGMGGLGSPIALYLAASGVGKIGLVDYDQVDTSNLQRQVLYTDSQRGQYKAQCAAQRLQDLNPEIEVIPMTVEFNTANARSIASGYEILVDGTDNIPTRYLLNDLAVLTHRLFVYGSIYQFEGQVSVFGSSKGPCYRCLFPEPPPPGSIPSCSSSGVMGVLPGLIGSIQAAEVIKLITGVGDSLVGRLLLFDALDMSMEKVNVRKRTDCPVCGANPSQIELMDYEAWCRTGIQPIFESTATEWDITPVELKKRLESTEPPLLLDVREDFERAISSLPDAVAIPFPDLSECITELPVNREIVVFCRNGIRSSEATGILRSRGFLRVWNLSGGINAWAGQVDPKIPIY